MTTRKQITSADLYNLPFSSAICNLLDMIDAGEISRDDSARITAVYWSHTEEDRATKEAA